jgi:hypothetical protein
MLTRCTSTSNLSSRPQINVALRLVSSRPPRAGTPQTISGLTAANNVSDNGTANTIVDSLNTHMADLAASVLLQTTVRNDANTAIFNASMNQVSANEAQCNNNHNCMMQQFAMLSTAPTAAPQFAGLTGQQAGRPQAATQRNFIPQVIPILAPAQQWGQPCGGRRGSTCSCNGRGHRNPRGLAQQGAPIPFVCGNQMIPYILAGMQPTQHQNSCYFNMVKQWANQNVCFSCRFDIEDWHASATCPHKKMGHMDGFTRTNYMKY